MEVKINSKFFKVVLEIAPVHVIVTNSKGYITYTNRAAEQLTGYTRKEMIGKKPSLWGKQMKEEFYAEMWHTIKVKKQQFANKIINQRKDGTKYISTILIRPILKNDKILGYVGIEQDITEIEKTKDLLKVYRNELKRLSSLPQINLSGTI